MQLSIIIAVGLVLIWVGERIVEAPGVRLGLTAVGGSLLAISAVARFLRSRDEEGELAAVHRRFAAFSTLALVGFGLYAIQSDLFTKVTGASLASSSPKLAGVLAVLWPVVLAAALLPTLLMELSFATMAKAPRLEDGRINEAMLSGLGLAGAITFAFTVQYVATERDVKGDFSYFRVAKAGDATSKLVASLDEPLEVYLFFPPPATRRRRWPATSLSSRRRARS